MTSSPNSDAIVVENLTLHYGHQTALWDVSFAIPSGMLVGIVGPNGAGKSTLLKALLKLLPITSGEVTLSQKKIAYVPQKESIDWDFPITVYDLILMGSYGRLSLCRRPSGREKEKARHYLQLVGLEPYAHRQISQLSGGQQQRAFLARALLEEAELYFMDEPFVGIDQKTEELLVTILKEMQEGGKTVCIVHHDLGRVRTMCDWILLLNRRLVAQGPTEEVLTEARIAEAYGTTSSLLDEALKRSYDKREGYR